MTSWLSTCCTVSMATPTTITGHQTHPYFGAYCVGKAGIEEMMKNFRRGGGRGRGGEGRRGKGGGKPQGDE